MPVLPPQLMGRRKELVLIGFNHIARRGFEGLRVRDVAAEAGINNATLHYYFPTKEDLIKGVVDYMIRQFGTSMASSDARKTADAWEDILADLEDARNRPRKALDQLVVYTELLLRSLRDPLIAKAFRKLDRSWRGVLTGVIRNGIKQGVFRPDLDPKTSATLIMLQIKGMGLQMFGETNREIGDEVFNQLVEQIKTGLTGELGTRRWRCAPAKQNRA